MGYRNLSALKMDEHDELEQQGQKEKESNVFLFHQKKNVRQKQMLNL